MQARVDARRGGRKDMRVFSLLPLRATFRVTGHDFHARLGKIFSSLFLLSLVKMRQTQALKPWKLVLL